MDSSAETAVGAGDHVLAADDLRKAQDPIGDKARMLDHVGRVAYDAGNDNLPLREFYILPDPPFVLVADVAGLERVALRANGEYEIDNVGERDVGRVRPVPASPADVITDAIFRQSAERVVERLDARGRSGAGHSQAELCLGRLSPAERQPHQGRESPRPA